MTLKKFLFVLCVVILIWSCESSRRIVAQEDLDQKLIAAIEKERTGEPFTVRLKDLTTFDWDKFYVFVPYQRAEDVRETLGIDWDPRTSIYGQDWDDLLVFVNRGSVVHYHDHPVKHGDFYGFRRTGYTPDDAVFEVTLEKHDRLVVRPVDGSRSSAVR
jgi:hypothetical protein